MLEPLGEERRPVEVHNRFDLFQEIARGAIYAGGEEAEQFYHGYFTGMKWTIVFLVISWVYGYIKMGCPAYIGPGTEIPSNVLIEPIPEHESNHAQNPNRPHP